MSRGCRPAPGAARPWQQLPLVPRKPGPECGCRSSSATDPELPARPGRARGSAGAPGTCAGWERPPSPARAGTGGRRHLGVWGVVMLEVWVGRPRRGAPARPGLRVQPGTAPSPGAADSQPRKAVRLSLPCSLPTEAAGCRCPVDRGSGRIRAEEGCHRAGAEPQPLYRTGQSSCPAPGNTGWPSAASTRTSRPEATWGKAPCRAAQVGEGTRPWAPAGRGTLQPRPPTRAAAALFPTPQPPPRRKEQGEK